MKDEAIIEAILFVVGDAVECSRIAQVIGRDTADTRDIIRRMMEQYETEGRGIQIIEIEDSFQMCTNAGAYESIVRIANVPRKHVLTDVLLETLSIIAYKQPITKLEIEAIRGVRADHSVNKLIEYNLVCEAGRLEAPGRPILFGTTEEFLRFFGMSSLDQLPIIESDKMAEFKTEIEGEYQLELDI